DLLATMEALTSRQTNPTSPQPAPPQDARDAQRRTQQPQDSQALLGQQPVSTAARPAERAQPGVAAAAALKPQAGQGPGVRADAESKPRSETQPTSALETAAAIRAALAPRKRRSVADAVVPPGEQPTSWLPGLWLAGGVLLFLLLTIQIVHHYRHDLAATAALNGPLTSIYAALGIPLVPRSDLAAYELRQLGASTAADAPGKIMVRASVKNGARRAQPLPLLRVTLQDRFGNRIASRDVSPQSYLPRALPRSSVLSAGQRIDAEMAFVDPGA